MSRLLTDLDPDVAEKATQLELACSAAGITIGFTQTYRSFAEQAALYAQGRTVPGPIVTHSPAGYSWHNWRRAFDVDVLTFIGDPLPRDLWNGPWDVVGALGERVGLEWGGRWKHADRPHFELRGNLTLAGLIVAHPKGLS